MKNNSTINRIKQYVDYKGISVRAFEMQCGFSNGSFASQLKNGKAIGSDRIENILCIYPELDANWLFTGKGEMICDLVNDSNATDNIYKKMYQEASKEIAMLNQEIGKLREQLAQSVLEQERMKNVSDAYTSDVKSVG